MLGFQTKNRLEKAPNLSPASGRRCPFKVFTVLSGVMATAGIILLIVSLIHLIKSWSEETLVVQWSLGIGLSLALVAMGTVIFMLTHLAKTIRDAEKTRENYSPIPSPNPPSAGAPQDTFSRELEQLQIQMNQAVRVLQDINENTLLDENGRRQKFEFLAHQDRKRIFNDIEKLVQDREWAQVKAMLEGMAQKYPGNAEVQEYARQADELRKQAFNDELAQTRKMVNDLTAISAWDKAIRHADILLEKHPDMAAAKELQLNVRAERNRFREEHVKKMGADVQRLIGKKRWNDALGIARQLIERYPDSVEAETYRNQMKTLETNAEIEKRQELEEQFKDLLRRRNFIQALELAKFVIENYPTSPQATALRNQIEKLEELSKQQEKEIQL